MLQLDFVSYLHRKLADYVRPPGAEPGTREHELGGHFASLFALVSIFVPFLIFEFWLAGFPTVAAALGLAGVGMLSSAWLYRRSGSARLARDTLLGTLFWFLVWENQYFASVFSPASAWFMVMPVVSVLLGSVRAGVAWLAAGLAALTVNWWHATSSGGGLPLHLHGNFAALYGISIVGLILAIFLFVLLVDAGRGEAMRKLAAANEVNRNLAECDELTGLFNRRAWHLGLRTLLQPGQRNRLAVLVADLDGFKDVNDTYGHETGDKVIRYVSGQLHALCDEHGAVLARLGGDEFAAIVIGNDAVETSRKLAHKALNLLASPILVDRKEISLGISLGLAEADTHTDATELMRRADVAMYEAKQQGGGRLCEFSSNLDAGRAYRMAVAEDLRRALNAGALDVHYQPIVDAVTHEVTGVEALARWTGLDGGMIPPDTFIPVAEECGLINQLGLYVLERACEDAAMWPDITLAVNLSPVQFRSPSLMQDVLGILHRTKYPAERLILEVTEGYLIEHRERARPVIDALRMVGIKVALDDFGSGYSSIGYLREYEFDGLKIDKSLIRGMAEDEASMSIVKATALLAKSLSLAVTAEGVESDEEARVLRLVGCSRLQGYFFGKPGPADAIARLLLTRPTAIAV